MWTDGGRLYMSRVKDSPKDVYRSTGVQFPYYVQSSVCHVEKLYKYFSLGLEQEGGNTTYCR